MRATIACAGSDRRPAHFSPARRPGAAAVRPHRRGFRRHRYRTYFLPRYFSRAQARSACRASPFPSTDPARCHVRQAHGPPALSNRHGYAAEPAVDQPIDQTNGGAPPAEGLLLPRDAPFFSIDKELIAEAANIGCISVLTAESDLQGAAMPRNILLAVCVGALALPLA